MALTIPNTFANRTGSIMLSDLDDNFTYVLDNIGSGGGGSGNSSPVGAVSITYDSTEGQTVFTTPPYMVGSGQLKIYVDGVRQYPGEYEETDDVTVTLFSPTNLGSTVLVEVDGYGTSANTIFEVDIYYLQQDVIRIDTELGLVNSNVSSLDANVIALSANVNSFTANINQNLSTTSNTQFRSLGVGTTASGVLGEIRAANNVTAYYSDERLKTKLGNIENALDKVNQLNGFYHEANETAMALGYGKFREVGVSAQEVQNVLPEIVTTAPISDEYLTVRYDRLTPLLIEAIKELNSKVEQLREEINASRN